MKGKLLSVVLITAVAGVLAGTAAGDPGGPNLQQPVAVTCSDGQDVVVSPGTATNVGRVAWVIDSNSVFVTAYLAFTDGVDTFVLFDSKPGLKGLVTCSGDAGGGVTVIARGFFTPR
jgi:hypothetical protein